MDRVIPIGRPFLFVLIGVCGLFLLPAWIRGGQGTPNPPPPALTYNIIDLGTFGGLSSVALAVNESGQVVGSADTSQGLRHAYRWENGVMTDLGTLGFPTAQSEAWDINNHGVVVGIVGGGDPNRAFIWQNGVQTEIGPPQVPKSANGINDAGQVVGIFVVPAGGGDQHAFVWENGTLTDLGTLGGGYSIAWDINESGQVVGGSSTGGASGGAFIWQSGIMTNLGTLGGEGSGAFDLNDSGSVVGWAQRTTEKNAPYHAFMWAKSVMTDLGNTLPGVTSSAEAINNQGEIVGWSFEGGEGDFHGFVYSPLTGIKLLEEMIPANSGWTNLIPRDINDAGWVVGSGSNPEGFAHAFLLTPATVVPAVSEYGAVVMTLLILTGGTIVILRFRNLRGRFEHASSDRVQEVHQLAYHLVCDRIEARFGTDHAG